MPIISIDGTSVALESGVSTSVVFTLLGAPPTGSFILVTIVETGGSNRTFTPPDDSWVLIGRQNNGINPANGTYYKIAGPSEPSSYTFTTDAAFSTAATLLVYLGVDQNNPISGVTGANGSSDSIITFGPVVTTSTYGQLFKTVAARNTSGPPTILDAGPSGAIVIQDGNSTGTRMMVGVMTDVLISSAGTYTPEDATMDLVCTKATVSFVVNAAISPPLAWIGV